MALIRIRFSEQKHPREKRELIDVSKKKFDPRTSTVNKNRSLITVGIVALRALVGLITDVARKASILVFSVLPM